MSWLVLSFVPFENCFVVMFCFVFVVDKKAETGPGAGFDPAFVS